MEPDQYDEDLAELEDDLAECGWHRDWAESRRYKDSISREGFADNGKWARFEYIDHHGATTKRTITRWEKRGAYIVGYDKSRGAERTFRQDRINAWVSG